MNVLIIGGGFVGQATYLLNNPDINIFIYDINKDLCIPRDIELEEIIEKIDLIFICVPTPLNVNGTCSTKIIENILKKVKHSFIVIRSTIPIGFCDKNKVFFMPEFLTEKNWIEDFINNKNWIFGIYKDCSEDISNEFKNKITKLINLAHKNNKITSNNIYFIENKEAEILKLILNTFLSTKVIYFNEIFEFTQKNNINYNNLIELIKLDDRIGNTHLQVPCCGLIGYGGTCFPKDTNSLYYQFQENGLNSSILEANLFKNEHIYRVERDWLKDKGRTNLDISNKIILVSGGAGFLGRNLIKRLLSEKENKIICVDNLITGSLDNIKEFMNNENFYFLNFDVTHKLFLPKVDEVYHLASLASPDKYKEFPIETILVNVEGTKNLLDLCKINKSKMLFTSTSEIYGDPLVHPQPESYYGNVNTMGERSCYDESKRMAETLIYEYKKKYNLDVKIVRIFNTYGEFMNINDGRVITNFIKNIKENKNVQIYGDGTQTRSFCYVDDMVDGLIKMMNSNYQGPTNLGNPNCEFTLNLLVEEFEKIIGKKIKVEYLKATENDPKQRKPIIDKAIKELGWFPKINLEEGLKRTLEYFKD